MATRTVKVGVLSIQGSFAEHVSMLKREDARTGDDGPRVTVTVEEVRYPSQLEELDGLIIPGGESTTLSVFLRQNDFEEKLKSFVRDKKRPVWGTCAGLILLSNQLDSQKKGGQVTIGGIDIQATRNAYGSQINSFEATLKLKDPALCRGTPNPDTTYPDTPSPSDQYHGVFIRAPGIAKLTSPNVRVLATLGDEGHQGEMVAVRQGHLMATAFHPELTSDTRWHSYFLDMILTH